MDNIQEMAAMAALNHMFKQGYVSVCTIDKVAKLMNVNPRGRAYDVLSTLHCVGFDQMPQELKESIPGMIRECLSLNPIYEFEHLKRQVVTAHDTAHQSPMGRLLSYVRG